MHEMAIRVYYEDTDLAGIVYYANYLRFIERGRSEALRALGIDQLALKAAGLVFVVRRVEADYMRPARFDDVIRVLTDVERVGAATVEMAQEVRRDDLRLFAARVTVAAMGVDGRPCRLPAAVRARLLPPA